MTLVDTSALYALADAADRRHRDAAAVFARVESEGEPLLVHSYVVAETFALLHRRHGLGPALRVSEETARLEWVSVDRGLHDRAADRLRAHPRPGGSLVDAVSFVLMEERGIETAFAFDSDFEEAGFRLLRG